MTSASYDVPTRPDLNLNNLQPGNWIFFENVEDHTGEVIANDVGGFLRSKGTDIIINGYWFKGNGAWEKWDIETANMFRDRIILTDDRLTQTGKPPRGVVSRL